MRHLLYPAGPTYLLVRCQIPLSSFLAFALCMTFDLRRKRRTPGITRAPTVVPAAMETSVVSLSNRQSNVAFEH